MDDFSADRFWNGHPDQYFGGHSYAQHGDDLMILGIFKRLGIDKPSYLDLGAHHPIVISNTALLYQRGSRGVNVEVNPNLIDEFARLRPGDVNACVAVGTEVGQATYYMYSPTNGRNTLCKEELDKDFLNPATVSVTVVPVSVILENHCNGKWPHFLNVDLEGMDFAVLEDADFSPDNCPKVICVETRVEKQTAEMCDLLECKYGYELLVRMGENLIFVLGRDMAKIQGFER